MPVAIGPTTYAQIAPVAPSGEPAPGQAPASTEGVVGTYQQVIRDALTEYEAGNWAEARALFEQAHTLRPSARTLRGLGMASFELRNYVRAERELTAALEDSRQPLTPSQRTELTAILQRIARYVGKLTVKVEPAEAEATVLLDGAPLPSHELELDLGPHQLSVTAPGYHSINRRLMIEGGKQQTLEIVLMPLEIKAQDAARSAEAAPPPTEAGEPEPATVPGPLIHADYAMGPRAGSDSVFETWWFWTAVGVVAAGGIVTAIAVANSGDSEPLVAGDNGQVIQVLTVSRPTATGLSD